MRLLVLGGSGMLGHKLCQAASDRMETAATVRETKPEAKALGLSKQVRMIGRVEATDLASIERASASAQPDVILNCVGIVKQSPLAQDPITSITVNALFPHQLARICRESSARLIHLRTDCVFSGRKGHYAECGSNILADADPEVTQRCVRTVLAQGTDSRVPPGYLARDVSDTVVRILTSHAESLT